MSRQPFSCAMQTMPGAVPDHGPRSVCAFVWEIYRKMGIQIGRQERWQRWCWCRHWAAKCETRHLDQFESHHEFLPRCRFFRFARFFACVRAFGCGTLSSGNDNHRLVSNAFLRWNGIFVLSSFVSYFSPKKKNRTHKAARLLGDADGILVLGELVQLPTYPVIVWSVCMRSWAPHGLGFVRQQTFQTSQNTQNRHQ